MHFLPLRCRSFADGEGTVDLPAVTRVSSANLADNGVAFLQLSIRMKLRRHAEVGIAHGHAAHKVNAGVTPRLKIDRLDDRGNLVFAHALAQPLGEGLDRLVGELGSEL